MSSDSLHSSARPTLTIIVQTRNEEQNIEACLLSCGDIADEILVVDMESTDATREKAQSLGARVLTVTNVGYVEPARQMAIDAASSTWVFLLDADERLTASLRTKIREYIAHPQANIVRFPRKNMIFGKWLKHGLMWPDYQVRLFQKGSLVWPTQIHSQPRVQEEVVDFPAQQRNAILHLHTETLQQRLKKVEQQSFQETYYHSNPGIPSYAIMERLSSEFPRRFFEHDGYKDGVRGFVHAKLMEYYRFLAFARYWEETGSKEIFSQRELQQLWDTNKQMGILLEENKRLRDAKVYRVYAWIKNVLTRFGLRV